MEQQGAEMLRLLQLTVHTLLVHAKATDVGHSGGRPGQMGAGEGLRERLAQGEKEPIEREGDGHGAKVGETEDARVRFQPEQTVPLKHATEKLDQGLRSGIVNCPLELDATRLGRRIAR